MKMKTSANNDKDGLSNKELEDSGKEDMKQS
jgi:hypothetical protein